jgi:hypothetical protein
MAMFDSPLDHVRVAAPCPADWDSMVGDERVRFCRQCELNVYNLSGMSRREAETLVTNAEGRLCVRFYRRADGSILTRNCPVGLRAIRRRVSRVANALASAALGFFAGLGLTPSPRQMTMGAVDSYPAPPREAAAPTPAAEVPGGPIVMGGALMVAEPRGGWTRGRMAITPLKEKRKPGRREGSRAGR